jgi:hypothetical protein
MSMTVPQQASPDSTTGTVPWIGYDAQHVTTIVGFVRKSTPTQVRAVQTYERANLDRAEVLDAADCRLVKWHA